MKKEIKLYTLPYCPYSKGTKKLLDERGLEYIDIDLFRHDEIRYQLQTKTHSYTVPFIFIGDKFIGGYSELKELDSCGELKELLK